MTLRNCLAMGLLSVLISTFGVGQEVYIPAAIRSYADSAYPGWRLSTITEEMRSAFFAHSKSHPSYIRGDFDGNGKEDYALQITYPDSIQYSRAVTVFIAQGERFTPYLLRSGPEDPERYIFLSPKGAKRFDWETEKSFLCPSDGISIGFAGKAVETFFFHHGKFNKIITGD